MIGHIGAAALAAIWLLGLQASAQTLPEQLYAAGDYAGAAKLWRDSAAGGSAEAKLALGRLAEAGLGQPRNPREAFQWYLAAASEGQADAQYSLATILEAGGFAPRDPAAALVWYIRAGLRGHVQAQFGAGSLLATGVDGKPDRQLATYWLRRAGSLPQARARLAEVGATPGPEGVLARPRLTFARVVPGQAELVWTSAPTRAGPHVVEIVAAPPAGQEYGEPVVMAVTEGNGLLHSFVAPDAELLWRVLRLDASGGSYVATRWRADRPGMVPLGRVRIETGAADPRIAAFAARLADDLRVAGYWVRQMPVGDAEPGVRVAYAYAADSDLARQIGAMLPEGTQTLQRSPGSTLPGEIVVVLGGADENGQAAQAD